MVQSTGLESAISLMREGRLDEAEAELALELRDRPNDAAGWVMRGALSSKRHDYSRAEACYRQAIAVAPELPTAHQALATILDITGRLEEAVQAYDRALQLAPGDALVNTSFGALLTRIGRIGEAKERLEAALSANPQLASAVNNLGRLLVLSGDIERGVELHRRAASLDPANAAYASDALFSLNYHPDKSVTEIAEAHFAWGRAAVAAVPAPSVFLNNRDPDRRLRIGYASPDFRNHAVGHALLPVLSAHDASQVEVTFYGEVERTDGETERFKTAAHRWRSTLGIGDAAVARAIRDDGIDVLVDMAGHSAGNRLGVFARRAAPVQVVWHGYPNTTGLPSVDYRMVDAISDPAGSDVLASEELIRLPGPFVVDVVDSGTPPVVVPPLFHNGFPTFGSFNNFAKVNGKVVSLWAAILRAVPGSRLYLKSSANTDEWVRDRYRRMFAAEGVDADRLRFGPHSAPVFEHLAAYGEVDIALDPFPFNGTSTTMEALRMGVPVVTLAGENHVARVGASLLTHVGHPEWIARNPESYVSAAIMLAQDRGRLAASRMRLRNEYLASPLANPAALARSVEAAYRAMWRKWCAAVG